MQINTEGLIPLLVLAAIVAAIVAAVIAWRRREGLEPQAEEGVGTLRRLYFYFGTFVYMMVASVGVVLVARFLLNELFGPTVLDRDVTQLALGVVLAFIWTPAWAWHYLRLQRLLRQEPEAQRSVLRKLAVYLTLGVTVALVTQGSVELLRWVLRAREFDGYPLAAAAVWSGLWAFSWVAENREGQPTDDTRTVRRLYLYAASAYSLAMLAAGASFVLYIIFREAYEGIVSLPVLLQGEESLWGNVMKTSLAVALVGAVLWTAHWLRFARADAGSDLRQFYLYTLAVLGGVVTTLSATGVLLFGLLQWGFGTPAESSASAHFRFLPAALAPLLIGLLLWAYHWLTVQQEQAALGRLHAARRLYRYVMTALGLGALATTVIVLVPAVIGIVVSSAQDVLVGPDWWRDQIVLVLTLGLLGVPVWGYHWYQAQRSAAALGAEERFSVPRRLLIFGVLGAGALAFLGSASHLLFLFLNAALEDELSLTLLREAKWSMGTLVAAALFTPYHWFVIQEDQRAAVPVAPRPAARKAVTLLIAEDGRVLVGQLEAVLGAKVRVLQRADPGVGLPALSAEDIQRLEQRISEAPGGRVLLVADATGVEVYSYR
ncbi:MAG: hypothetical protein A2148_10540 [Chloroflexi bacterium RBG_16_68_14]|nr:MAG: hypothetical protein A2148_10540 [Chloroflexi bacterium RBG_16_68_14]